MARRAGKRPLLKLDAKAALGHAPTAAGAAGVAAEDLLDAQQDAGVVGVLAVPLLRAAPPTRTELSSRIGAAD